MGDGVTPAQKKSFSEIFDEECPQYMAIGMPYDVYWEQDPWIAAYYRKAYRVRIETDNYNAWLNGLYTYVAVSTTLSNIHLDGKSHKRNDYPKQPYSLFGKSDEEKQEEERKHIEDAVKKLNAFKAMWDKKK